MMRREREAMRVDSTRSHDVCVVNVMTQIHIKRCVSGVAYTANSPAGRVAAAKHAKTRGKWSKKAVGGCPTPKRRGHIMYIPSPESAYTVGQMA